MFGETDHVFYFGAPPAIDVLVIIADHKKIMIFSAQQGQQLLLVAGYVLKFITEDIHTAVLPGTQDFRVGPQQIQDHMDQVCEIRQVVVPLQQHIGIKELMEVIFRFAGQPGQRSPVRTGHQRDIIILMGKLEFLDILQIFLRRHVLQTQSQVLRGLPDQIRLICLVDNGKGPGPVEMEAFLFKDQVTETMESTHETIIRVSHQFLQTPPHGSRRFIGKGQAYDGGGVNIQFRDQISDPVGQAESLAGTGHGGASLISFCFFYYAQLVAAGSYIHVNPLLL